MTSQMVRMLGFRLLSVSSAAPLIEFLKSAHPDCILLQIFSFCIHNEHVYGQFKLIPKIGNN